MTESAVDVQKKTESSKPQAEGPVVPSSFEKRLLDADRFDSRGPGGYPGLRQCSRSRDESSRERMDRITEDRLRSSAFHDLAAVDKRDAMAEPVHGGKIVRDEKNAHAGFAVQL